MNKKLLFSTLALFGIALLCIWYSKQSTTKNVGTLILLNGTSSSGKSAILHIFHQKNPTFTIFKIDDYYPAELIKKAKELGWHQQDNNPWSYLANYVEQKTGRPNFDTQVRAYLLQDTPPMYDAIKEALLTGHNCILDTVFEYDPEYAKFSKFFKEFNCLKVLIYCPLDVLIERVNMRNRSGIKEETRTVFQSFEQFPAMYKLQEHEHEPVIDIVSSETIKAALDAAIKELIENKIPKKYMQPLEEFKQAFIKQFKLDELKEIKLVPRHEYDLILNSAKQSPEELAAVINQKLSA